MRELIVKRPGQALQRFTLAKDEIVLGRDVDCGLTLLSTFVSRRHARLTLRGEDYEVEDLGSRNGVFLNGERLTRKRSLRKGDELAIADFAITYWESTDEDETSSYEVTPTDLLRVDREGHEVWLGNQTLDLRLSPQEFALLALLYEERGSVCDRQKIGEAIWGSTTVGNQSLPRYDDTLIHRLVARLRAKLETAGLASSIKNVPGVGYKID